MNRPRDRASAEGLLPRMEARPWASGGKVTYRYHPVGGKPINLGTDREAALRQVLDLVGQRPGHGSMAWLWEQWQKGKRWAKLSEGTRTDYALAWKQINDRFGHMAAAAITSPMVARYVHVERAGSPRRADIEKTIMSNLFRHGIMLGVCNTNPTIGVEPHGSEASDVMPETAALKAFTGWLAGQTPQRKILGLMAEYAACAGNRRVEFLDVTWFQVDREAGEVRTPRAKQRGKKRGNVFDVVSIQPALADVLDRIKALGRDGPYLFPTEDNNAYTDRGFKSLWQRCMIEAIEAKIITPKQRFNFHALRRYYNTLHRAKYGSNANLHSDPRLTARVYDATKDEHRKAL
jgi:integrase